jgi:hypothetical protein
MFLDIFFRRANPARALDLAGLPRRHRKHGWEDVSDDVCVQR